MAISSQLPNLGHATQSFQTFIGRSRCSTVRNPIFSKNPGTSVSAWVGVNSGLVVVADVTDANPDGGPDDWTGSINWGGGVLTPAQFAADGSGGYYVLGEHTWSSAGTFPITATIVDDGGQTATATSTGTVATPAFTLVGTNGQSFSGLVTTFTTAGSATSASITRTCGSPPRLGRGFESPFARAIFSEEGAISALCRLCRCSFGAVER